MQPKELTKSEELYSIGLEITPELELKVLLSLLEDISNEKETLAQQTKVNFSILEDIHETQAELKRKYFELDALKKVAEEIGYTLNLKRVLEILTKSIEKLLDYTSVSYMLFEKGEGKVVFNVYLRQSAGPLFLESVKKNIKEALQALAPGAAAAAATAAAATAAADTDLEVHYFGKQIDKKSTAEPQSFFNVPMILHDKVLGMLNIASTKPDLYKAKEMEPVYTMASQASLAIARLRELIASEHSRLGDLVESMTNGVLMFDINKRVVIANPVMKELVQLEGEHLALFDFLKPFESSFAKASEDKEKKINLSAAIDEALVSVKTVYIEEFPFKNKFFEIFITPVRDYQKKVSGGAIILHDITHLKEIDRMKTEFVSIASHQLRTPLGAIKLFTEMLIDKGGKKLDAKQKDYLDNIYQSTQRMVKLVNDLLNVSRLETGRLKIELKLTQLEDFIQDIIKEAAAVAAATAESNIVFKKPKTKLPKIPIDPSLMRQVIHNLIMNAIRYSPAKRCNVLVKLEQKGHDCVVSVKDNGIGISKGIQSRIFQKFFRADNAMKAQSEGSGLGLYVAKMIIEASGGKIWFASEAKKGTTFCISIPIKGMPKKKGEKGLADNK